MKNIFDQQDVDELIGRINQLTPSTTPQWGKMNVAQMLAHCNVAYSQTYEPGHEKPGWFKTQLIKLFVKSAVVGEKPYKKNGPTAPAFLIKDERNFDKEKERLIGFIQKTKDLGADHFDGKASHSMGSLTTKEWNNLFYKHLDHHLQQFGV